MRVLMTADAVGGVWTYALELCAALSRREIEVVLATMGPEPNDDQHAQAHCIPGMSLRTSNFRLEWMEDPWRDVALAGEWLIELARDEQVDLVHLNGYAHAALSWRRPVVVVAHSCVCSWWHAVRGEAPPALWGHYKSAVERGLAHASWVVAPTHAFMNQLQALYTFSAPRCVIQNARTSPAAFACAEARKELFIFASGRLWDEAKNMRVLEAVAQDGPWPIYVAGDARSPDGRTMSTGSLRCLGRQSAPQMTDWLARASIFVHPARYEPFGLAVLEAAQASCALVLSDLETLRESWEGAAIFVDSGDPMQIGLVVNELMHAPAELHRLGSLARERAAQFTPARMADAYHAVYRDLLRHSARERSVA